MKGSCTHVSLRVILGSSVSSAQCLADLAHTAALTKT